MACDGEGRKKNLPKFPPGYRFLPTDEELMEGYLLPKLAKEQLPYDIINDVNIYDFEPHELIEKYKEYGENKWYFFTPRQRKYANGSRPDRRVKNGAGYWKLTGADKIIRRSESILSKWKATEEANKSCENGDDTLGKKKSLVYYEGSSAASKKTDWLMYEYIAGKEKGQETKKQNDSKKLDDCVLCVIKKKGSGQKEASGASNKCTSMAFRLYNGNNQSMVPQNPIPRQNSQAHQAQPTITTDSQLQVYDRGDVTHMVRPNHVPSQHTEGQRHVDNMTDDYLSAPNVAVYDAIGGNGTKVYYYSSMASFDHLAVQSTEDHGAMVDPQVYHGTGGMALVGWLASPPPGDIAESMEENNYEGRTDEGQAPRIVSDYEVYDFQYCDGNAEGHGTMVDSWDDSFDGIVKFQETEDEVMGWLASPPPGDIAASIEENNNQGRTGEGQAPRSVSDHYLHDFQYCDGNASSKLSERNTSHGASSDPQPVRPPKS